MVEQVLKDMPEARNSDITLMCEVWQRFYPLKVKCGASGEKGVWLKDLYELPREDNIKRVRAQFQNDKGLYLPTEWRIAKQRGINEDEWRVSLGYPTKQTTGTPVPSWTPPSEQTKLI